MESKKRIFYLDVLRTIGIYFVVILHVVNPIVNNEAILGTKTWWACNIIDLIGRMGVPLFFMISGYLFLSNPKTRNIKSFYRGRLKRLLIPFIFWNIFYYIWQYILSGAKFRILPFFYYLANYGVEYHFWFIYQLIALYLIFPFLKIIVDHTSRTQLKLFFFIILLQPTIFRFINVIQPFIYIAPFNSPIDGYVAYVILGYLLGTSDFRFQTRVILYISAFFALPLSAYGNYIYSSVDQLRLNFNEGYSITHFITASALFILIRQTASDGGPENNFAKVIKAISNLSFGIYFIHIFAMWYVQFFLEKMNYDINSASYAVTASIATALFSTLLIWMISKIPLLKKVALS